MRGLAIVLISLAFMGCNFDNAFKRYCDKNPKCAPDTGVQTPVETGVQPPMDTNAQPPMDTSMSSVDVPKSEQPFDGGDSPRFGDGGPGPGGPLPPPKFCDGSPQGPGACDPGYTCSMGGFCLKTCATSADCRAAQPYNPQCVPLPFPPGINVCACEGNSCASKDSAFECSRSDFICLRKCYADSDCQGGPSFAIRRLCNVNTQVCTINACKVDDDCKSINPALRCDQPSWTCVP